MDAAHTEPDTAEAAEDEQEVVAQIEDSAATEVATGQVETREAERPTHQVSKRDRIYRRSASRDFDNEADIDQLASDHDHGPISVNDSDEDNRAVHVKTEDHDVISIRDSDEDDGPISVQDSDDDDQDSDYKMSDGDDDGGRSGAQSGMGRSGSGTRSRARTRSWKREPGFPQENADEINVSSHRFSHVTVTLKAL